jgi:hypothetical protein
MAETANFVSEYTGLGLETLLERTTKARFGIPLVLLLYFWDIKNMGNPITKTPNVTSNANGSKILSGRVPALFGAGKVICCCFAITGW